MLTLLKSNLPSMTIAGLLLTAQTSAAFDFQSYVDAWPSGCSTITNQYTSEYLIPYDMGNYFDIDHEGGVGSDFKDVYRVPAEVTDLYSMVLYETETLKGEVNYRLFIDCTAYCVQLEKDGGGMSPWKRFPVCITDDYSSVKSAVSYIARHFGLALIRAE